MKTPGTSKNNVFSSGSNKANASRIKTTTTTGTSSSSNTNAKSSSAGGRRERGGGGLTTPRSVSTTTTAGNETTFGPTTSASVKSDKPSSSPSPTPSSSPPRRTAGGTEIVNTSYYDSYGRKRCKYYPVPVSIILRNLLPPTASPRTSRGRFERQRQRQRQCREGREAKSSMTHQNEKNKKNDEDKEDGVDSSSSSSIAGDDDAATAAAMSFRPMTIDPSRLLIPVRLEVVLMSSSSSIISQEEEEEKQQGKKLGRRRTRRKIKKYGTCDSKDSDGDDVDDGIGTDTTPSLDEEDEDVIGSNGAGDCVLSSSPTADLTQMKHPDHDKVHGALTFTHGKNQENEVTTTHDKNDNVIIYSSMSHGGKLNPQWEHLDERIDLLGRNRRVENGFDNDDDHPIDRNNNGRRQFYHDTTKHRDNKVEKVEDINDNALREDDMNDWDVTYQSMFARVVMHAHDYQEDDEKEEEDDHNQSNIPHISASHYHHEQESIDVGNGNVSCKEKKNQRRKKQGNKTKNIDDRKKTDNVQTLTSAVQGQKQQRRQRRLRHGDDDDHNRKNNNSSSPSSKFLLAETPLHPTFLRRLPQSAANTTTTASSSSSPQPPPPLASYYGGFSPIIPSSLPPNAILVQYSDGSTRVHPHLYQFLLQNNVIKEDPTRDEHVAADLLEINRRMKRFSDDEFAALDAAAAAAATTAAATTAAAATGMNDNNTSGKNDCKSNTDHNGASVVQSPSDLLYGKVDRDDDGYNDDDDVYGGVGDVFVPKSLSFPSSSSSVGGNLSAASSFVDDDVFDLLGPAAAGGGGACAAVHSDTTATTNVVGHKTGEREQHHHHQRQQQQQQKQQYAPVVDQGGEIVLAVENGGTNESGEESKGKSVWSSLLPKDASVAAGTAALGSQIREVNTVQEEGERDIVDDNEQRLKIELDMKMGALEDELLALEGMLELELSSLDLEKCDLQTEMDEVRDLVARVREKENEIELIKQEAEKEVKKLSQLDFFLEARKAKLLMDVREIYPIQCLSQNRYSIRGLEIPADGNSPLVTDEELSAALGFLCHLVFMCSKYLSIPLRYRLLCNSSRSAIQDDVHGILPLFKERGVEKEQFDRGVLLLERNIECLLKMRGIEYLPRSHILAKLNRLFERTIEGAE